MRPLLPLLILLLAACSNSSKAPIEDRSYPRSPAPREYRVLRGDTLYSIAFRYGLDYRRLAAANSVAAPFTIYPGQRLRLVEASPAPATSSASARAAAPARTTDSAAASSAAKTNTAGGRATASGASATAPAPRVSKPVAATAPRVPAPATPSASGWRWPSGGAVTRRFDSNLHKGIDIAGSRGDPVQAAENGQVVYAGRGIAGYGLLLILRHSNDYLSAYAHNEELLVAEGEQVRGGQTVARMGNSGTDTVKLHFELRRRGRPIDPLLRLPPR